MPTIDDIRAARERIAGEITPTPCRRATSLEEFGPRRAYLKLENLHRTGSFKERGALNKLLTLSDEERRRGVITASAGNHAQALAYHAGHLGIAATVVMPVATPLVKVGNTRRYGGRVILHGATFDDAVEEALRRRDAEGQVYVPAFNDDAVVAGQGTIGLELLEQLEEVDVARRAGGRRRPDLRHRHGDEGGAAGAAGGGRRVGGGAVGPGLPRGRPDRRRHQRRHHRRRHRGQEGGRGHLPAPQRYVDELVAVDDEQIAAAIVLLLEREKTLAEGAGAAAVAALASGAFTVGPEETVVLVLSGGNIDINMVSRIIDRGLVADGRLTRLVVRVRDRPGRLAKLLNVVGGLGANVLETEHRRAFADISVGEVEIVLVLETRGREHLEEIITALGAEGPQVEEAV